MLIAGVLCVSVAVVSAALGLRALLGPRTDDPARLVLRAVAPAQLAAAALLAAGGAVALAGPPRGALLVLILSVAGAASTLVAGFWQAARYAARRRTAPARASGCGCGCGCAQAPQLNVDLRISSG